MKKENNIQLCFWYDTTEELTNYFIGKYFGKPQDVEHWWVADEIGGVLYINDYFFNLSDIVDYIKYRYTKNKMFANYDYQMKLRLKNEIPINIKNWIKLKN